MGKVKRHSVFVVVGRVGLVVVGGSWQWVVVVGVCVGVVFGVRRGLCWEVVLGGGYFGSSVW